MYCGLETKSLQESVIRPFIHSELYCGRVDIKLIVCAFKVVDEYNRREQEIKHLDKDLEEQTNTLNAYRQKISGVAGLSP